MMIKLIHKTITFLLLLFYSINGLAQQNDNSCNDALNLANKEYEAGHISECIELLKPCIDKLDGKVVFEAHRLLALCYLNLNDEKNANIAAVNLLRYKPDYREFPYFDPKDFTNLLAKYDVWPQLKLGIKAGVNFNSVRPIKNYSVIGSDASFLPGTGYQAGVLAEYFFRKNTSANLEILVEGLGYTRTSDNVSGWKQEFKEKMAYLSIPLGVRHYFYQSKAFGIGLELGVQSQFLLKTNSNIIFENPETGENIQNTLDQKSQRNKVLFSAYPGILINLKLGSGWFIANVRYGIGLTNVVNPDKRYENLDFSLSNQYIDSDIAFNPLYISFGYQFPVHKMYAVKLRK